MNDYHIHTIFSDDADISLNEMIEGAITKGMDEVAITDHYDPDYPDPEFPFALDFPAYHKAMEDAQKEYEGRIVVRKGIEVGIQHGETMDQCRQAVHGYDYDIVIGSFHCFNGMDLYKADYASMEEKDVIPAFYTYVRDCLKEYKCYDVLGHINVIDRYVPFAPDHRGCMDLIEEILHMVIEDGKGIEINTSSFRYGMGMRTTPTPDILLLYKQLGGEILTIGSDAHKPNDIGHRFTHAQAMAEDMGFRYLTSFKGREPVMVPISEVPR